MYAESWIATRLRAPGEVDGAFEEPVRDHGAGGVVGVVEVEKVRSLCDGGRNRLQLRHEAVLCRERQVMDLRAREHRARRVRRVARVRRQGDVAGIEARQGHVGDSLLPAQDRDDLGVRVDVDAEAVPIEARDGLSKRGEAAVRRVLVRLGTLHGFLQCCDYGRRRRQVRVANAERDDVDALGPHGIDAPLDLGEEVRRDPGEPLSEPHLAATSSSSSAEISPVQISCAAPVRRAFMPSSRSTRMSPPAR